MSRCLRHLRAAPFSAQSPVWWRAHCSESFARSFKSDDARKEKLNTHIAEKVEQILQRDVRVQLLEQLEKRRDAFAQSLQQAFDTANDTLRQEISGIDAEESELARVQEEIIGRLAPKIEQLSAIGGAARAIVEVTAPKEAL